MTQIVIGVFETPDTAYEVEETIMDQEGIDESCFHIAAQEGSQRDYGPQGQSMEEIRNFLMELFGPESREQVDYYATQIRRGGALLSIDLPDDIEIEPIRETMLNAGATSLNARRSEQGQEEGQTIPVIEEEMEVGKREVGKGNVRVTSRVEETPVQEDVSLREEHATIRRRPVDRSATPEDIDALSEESIEIEETAERPVINKSARVVEEVEVGKETSERTETVEDTVRRTDVNVEREAAKGSSRKGGK